MTPTPSAVLVDIDGTLVDSDGLHVPDTSDLRSARLAAGLTLEKVADHFNVWPTAISRLERGLSRNDQLETSYRAWLTTMTA